MSKQEAIAALENYPLYSCYENDANVFAMFLAFDARTGTLQKVLGTTYRVIFTVGRKGSFPMYTNHEDCERIAHIILRKLQEDQRWFREATAEVHSRASRLLQFSKGLKKLVYSEKDNRELLRLYEEYVTLFKEMRIYSSIPMMLEHDSPVLSNFLKEQLKKDGHEEKLNEVFSVLTTPLQKSYLFQEELERLKIAVKLACGENIQEEIKAHTEKWNWKEYLFEGTPLTERDFLKQIEQDIKQYKDPEKKVQEIEQRHDAIIKKQEEYLNDSALSKETKYFAEIARDIVYLKYFRKGVFAESYYCAEFLLRAIGERLHLTLDDVRAMFDWEVNEALTLGLNRKQREEINARRNFCAFISYKGKSYPLTEEEAMNIQKKNVTAEEVSSELKGQVTCSGHERGEVCIVNTVEDMKKMKEGNILVSIMTNPNLFPAMKIARAILTEIGGLSCHAAIVARELRIPCIVGLRNATKVLKNGNIIEVDANKGTVTVIK